MIALLAATLPASAGYGVWCADIACADCQALPIASVDAETTLPGNYGPELAFDGDLSTAWCEGAEGSGLHRSLTVTLSEPRRIEAILIHGGYFKSEPLLAANGRLSAVSVVAGDAEGMQFRADSPLSDPTVIPEADFCAPGQAVTATSAEWFERTRRGAGALVWQSDGDAQSVTSLSFTIAGVYPGSKYEDTCISEIQILSRP